jgi:hypothetical protein
MGWTYAISLFLVHTWWFKNSRVVAPLVVGRIWYLRPAHINLAVGSPQSPVQLAAPSPEVPTIMTAVAVQSPEGPATELRGVPNWS